MVVMPLIRSVRCRALGALLAVIAATLVATGPSGAAVGQTAPTAVPTTAPAGPTTTLSPAEARARIKKEQAQAGGEISSLRSSDADVRKALDDLDAKLAAANGALD